MTRKRVVEGLVAKAAVLEKAGRYEEALASLQVVIVPGADPASADEIALVAQALSKRAEVLVRLDHLEQALVACNEVVTRFGATPEPGPSEAVVRALYTKGIVLRHLGRHEDAVITLDEVIRRLSDRPPPNLYYLDVDAWFEKRYNLSELGRLAEALDACDALIVRYSPAMPLRLREKVARTMWLKGRLLAKVHEPEDTRVEQVMAVLDELLGHFGDAIEPELRRLTVRALHFKARLGLEHGRVDQGLDAIRHLLAQFANGLTTAQRGDIATRLVNSGETLLRVGLFGEALGVFEAVIVAEAAGHNDGVQSAVAHSLYDASWALVHLGRVDQAMTYLDDLLAKFGGASAGGGGDWALRALCRKAQLLLRSGQPDAARALSEKVNSLLATALPQALLLECASMALETGLAFLRVERSEEAVAVFSAVVDCCEDQQDPSLRRLAVHALNNAATALARLGREEEAMAAHREMLTFGEDAVDAFDESARDAERRASPGSSADVAKALLSKVAVLDELGRRDEALHVLANIAARFEQDEDRHARQTAEAARRLRRTMTSID